MAYAVKQHSKAAGGPDPRERLLQHVQLVTRHRELITSALNRLLRHRAVESALMLELRHLEEALPGVRREARASVPWQLPGSGEQGRR